MDERVLVCFGDSNTHGSPPSTGEPAGAHVRTSAVDGVHLDPDAHRALGEAVAAAVR